MDYSGDLASHLMTVSGKNGEDRYEKAEVGWDCCLVAASLLLSKSTPNRQV